MYGGGRYAESQPRDSWLGSQPESQRQCALPPVPDWAATPQAAAAALSRFAPAASARGARPAAQPWVASQSQASLVTPARSSLTGGAASQHRGAPQQQLPAQHAAPPPPFAHAQPLPWESAAGDGRRGADRRFGAPARQEHSFASAYASQPPVLKPAAASAPTPGAAQPGSAPGAAAAVAAAFASLNGGQVELRLAAIEESCRATQASVTSLAMALESLAASHRQDAGAGTLTAEALQGLQRAVMQLAEQHSSTAQLAACAPALVAAVPAVSAPAAASRGASGAASRPAPEASAPPKPAVRASKRQRRATRRFAEEEDDEDASADLAAAADGDDAMPLASAAPGPPVMTWPAWPLDEGDRDDPFAFLSSNAGGGSEAAVAAARPVSPQLPRATATPPAPGALVPWAWTQAGASGAANKATPLPTQVPLRTVAVVLPPLGADADATRGGAPWRKLRREAPPASAAAAAPREE